MTAQPAVPANAQITQCAELLRLLAVRSNALSPKRSLAQLLQDKSQNLCVSCC
jgi:hypothetical protein